MYRNRHKEKPARCIFPLTFNNDVLVTPNGANKCVLNKHNFVLSNKIAKYILCKISQYCAKIRYIGIVSKDKI